jgi:hypothetical protein
MLEMVNDFTDHIVQGLEEVKVALTKAKDEYAMYYTYQHEPTPVFSPDNKVWLDGSDIATNQLSSKLSHQQLSPFTVETCVRH